MPTYPLFDFFQEAIMIVWTSREWTWSWIENNIKSVLSTIIRLVVALLPSLIYLVKTDTRR